MLHIAATNYKTFRLAGISEAAVRELLKDLVVDNNTTISYHNLPGEIQIKIMSGDTTGNLENISANVKNRLKDYVFSSDGEIIEDLVGELLKQKGLTIALAESLTGGLIAARLTEVPGSSQYIKGGIVAYSNELKEKLLGVPPDILEKHGAVSRETASAMAYGIRNRASSDIGLAVTGIAGPGGDTPDKPLGLVYIALSAASGILCDRYIFPGNRTGVRQGTVNVALSTVRRFLT